MTSCLQRFNFNMWKMRDHYCSHTKGKRKGRKQGKGSCFCNHQLSHRPRRIKYLNQPLNFPYLSPLLIEPKGPSKKRKKNNSQKKHRGRYKLYSLQERDTIKNRLLFIQILRCRSYSILERKEILSSLIKT